MVNFRNQKGSITLFILISCMFFIASVVCVQMYMQSKQTAVDREYRQIKSNYEGDLLNETVLTERYNKISNLKKASVTILKTTKTDKDIKVEFSLVPNELDIKMIKYGWGTNESTDTVNNWIYMEKKSVGETMLAKTNIDPTDNKKEYHLFVVINNRVIYMPININS